MPLVSKTVEVNADADTILRIVADFEAYPDWNPEAKAVYVLARYDDGRPSQLRLDMEIQGQSGTFIQAVYYPGEGQIQTVLQQGEVFTKQDQLFSVVAMGPSSLLTVDLDVEVSLPVPAVMVKKLINDVLEHLANNLKARAEQLSATS
ncbi:SRPBCC family protein [Mycobacterium sp. EPa45]|uniref:SRPBCC family protein n=1 Tax=Mycobacterium sp. EPa45 TaxID=1545728 RepID=UPI0006424C6B|nr:SRPBCC family protein [Mycobacterium sp. EPa45]AKK25591.1 cyclase [Mycobacterium sp. EPa45]